MYEELEKPILDLQNELRRRRADLIEAILKAEDWPQYKFFQGQIVALFEIEENVEVTRRKILKGEIFDD